MSSSKPNLDDLRNAPLRLPVGEQQSYSDPKVLAERFKDVSRELDDAKVEILELKTKHSNLKQKLQTKKTLDKLLTPLSNKAFKFMACYSGGVGLLLMLHGLKDNKFILPDTVLEYLVGSTAVTVVGLCATVLSGVFIGARSSDK